MQHIIINSKTAEMIFILKKKHRQKYTFQDHSRHANPVHLSRLVSYLIVLIASVFYQIFIHPGLSDKY